MFLGALGFAYVTLDRNSNLENKNKELVEENEKLSGKNILFSHYVKDLGDLLGKSGTYGGRANTDPSLYANQKLEGVEGVQNLEAVKKVMEDACQQAGVAQARGLEAVLAALNNKVGQLNTRVGEIESERDKVLGEKSTVDASLATLTTETNRRAGEWRQSLDQARTDFDAAKNDRDARITSLQQNVRDKNDEYLAAKETWTAAEKKLVNEKRKLEMHNSALLARDAMINPPDVADGKVVAARSGVMTAFIDLGRKDMLVPGTVFRVKNPHSDAVKAYATVTRVEAEKAEVELSGIVDPIKDAVREGDRLFNDIYAPGKSRTIFLLGRFSYPYNKPELETLLRNLGNKIATKMEPGVDTVILGPDLQNEDNTGFIKVQDTAEYKLANDLRVEFVTLHKIRDLIKL
jgi:hypothetical protein